MGQRNGNTPPAPIEVKVAKLDFTGLAQAYDWATIDQVFGMRLAFGWYNENAPFLLAMDPPDTIRQKTYERAVKAQKLGEGTTIVDEQKQAFTTALHLFEKLWTPKQPALPLVDPALAPDTKPSKSLAWQQTLLEAFKVFQPFGLNYVPSLEAERVILPNGYKPISMKDIHIPVTELAQMSGSVLSVLLKEAVEVAKETNTNEIREDGKEKRVLDGGGFLATLPKVLEAVAATAGGKVAVAPKMPKERKADNVTNTSSQTYNTADPFGFFRTGSAQAACAAELADGQWHQRDQMLEKFSSPTLWHTLLRLKSRVEYGATRKTFRVV
jgi:hypothetical protein